MKAGGPRKWGVSNPKDHRLRQRDLRLQKAEDGEFNPGCQTAEVCGRCFARATEKDVEGEWREIRVCKQGAPALHRHTLNRTGITPALEKIQTATHISAKDTRASYITNALDRNERMSFIQKQVGHTTTRMIVDHYYRHVPAPDDGDRLEEAWNSTTLLPPSEDAETQLSYVIE
jgi:hypothetical protein